MNTFQRIVEGGVATFLVRYRAKMARLAAFIAAMPVAKVRVLRRVVIGINLLLFLGIVYCMTVGITQWIQFGLAVALYVGYQVFYRSFADRLAADKAATAE